MSKRVYFELSRYVRQSQTVLAEVPDDFDGSVIGYDVVERLHEAVSYSGREWDDDVDYDPRHLDAYARDEAPGVDEEVDVSLVDDDDDDDDDDTEEA